MIVLVIRDVVTRENCRQGQRRFNYGETKSGPYATDLAGTPSPGSSHFKGAKVKDGRRHESAPS
jgi:hypothetical protein